MHRKLLYGYLFSYIKSFSYGLTFLGCKIFLHSQGEKDVLMIIYLNTKKIKHTEKSL